MKREDLWVLLGEAPTEMIEEASTAQTGKKVLWLRWVLPLAAAVVLLTATVLAAGKYFGWQQVLETKPEELTESTKPLGVTVNAEDITFTVTEALADERVLYLLWEMQAPAAIFDERSTADGWLDFGEASVDAGGGAVFSAQPPKEKSNILCGYLVADWNDAMRGSTAHLRVSGLGHLKRTADTFIAKVDMKALCDSAVRKGVDLDEWISNYPQMIGDGEGSYEVVNTDGEVVQTIDMAYYEDGRLYVFHAAGRTVLNRTARPMESFATARGREWRMSVDVMTFSIAWTIMMWRRRNCQTCNLSSREDGSGYRIMTPNGRSTSIFRKQ